MNCPRCNSEILQDDKFCNNCGYMLSKNDLHLSQHKHKKIKAVPIIISLCTVAVLSTGAFVGFKFFDRYKQAQAQLNMIDRLIASNYYSEAYNQAKSFKTKYNFGSFPKEVDSRLKTLNKDSDDAYKQCIQILSSDQTENFSESSAYLKSYVQAFDYSNKKNSINTLLKSITDYQSKYRELSQKSEAKQTLTSNTDLLSTLNSEVSELQTLHKLADEAVNQNNQQSKSQLISLWANNYNEYNNIYDTFSSLEQSGLYDYVFSKDDCDLLSKFASDSLLPAQAVYRYDTAVDLKSNSTIANSFNEYNNIEPKISSIISSKKSVIDDFNKNYDTLEQEVKDLHDKIKNTETTSGSGASNI
ncbi:MAG: zinc ribbon domain-containing protein [Bacillota bacterium]|nr:zinc ribbon domain-containing protein [Bacillota bacterium]